MQHKENVPASQPLELTAPSQRRAMLPQASVGALLGLLLFAWLVGFQVVVPSNTNWLLDSADPTTHYLGWSFFRHDQWRMPLGLNPNYGLATGSSIVYSDSIPLMALLLKPLSPWLGERFQYTGLWLLLCFMLQGAFAMLLVGRVIPRLLPQTLAAILLMLPFIFLKRLDGHYALAAHWPILWALYLYLSPAPANRRRAIMWAVLACLAVLIHLYLAVLVLAIWSADLLRRYLADRRLLRPIGLEVAAVIPPLLCTMWLTGYFCLGFSDTRTPNSAGAYSMNLLSLIDSRGFSLLLPALPLERPGQVEGAAYLGLGILAMLAITLLTMAIRRPTPIASSSTRYQASGTHWPPLLIVCALLLLFAISPIITCGSTRLLSLPNYWGGISEVLRATGRMSWPAIYVLPLLLFTALSARLSSRMLTATLAAGLLIQILDLVPMLQATYQHFRTAQPPIRTLSDPFWTNASQRYRRIMLVPSDAPDIDWYPLAFFAADHGMSINHGYFARMNWSRKEAANQQAITDLRTGRFSPDTIYILTTDQSRSIVPQQSLRQVDIYTVFTSPMSFPDR